MENKKFYLFALLIMVVFCIGLVYENMSDRKNEKSLNDSLLIKIDSIHQEQKKQVTADSLKYIIAIDSLNKEIKTIQNKRYNERNKLQKQISSILLFTDVSSFSAYNDSIEKCCTMRQY